MADDLLWSLDAHGRVKHLILQRHLDAWLPIMTRSFRDLLYVDGFAGPGVYLQGEPGSPIIALRAAILSNAFSAKPPQCDVHFLFIEEREDRAARLQHEINKLLQAHPLPGWLTYSIEPGEFEAIMSDKFYRWSMNGYRPIFAFIDPFGYSGHPMRLIRRIARVPHSECLINFAYQSINRWAIHGDEKREAYLDALYDSPEWRARAGSEEMMVDFYRSQLRDHGGFRYNCTFKMKDSTNSTEYFLAFATNDPKGLSVFKSAAWKADPVGGRVFSDAADPHQLFLKLPLDPLRKLIEKRFTGAGWLSRDAIDEFVRDTQYSEDKHLVKSVLVPMEKEGRLIVDREPGSKRFSFNRVRRMRFV